MPAPARSVSAQGAATAEASTLATSAAGVSDSAAEAWAWNASLGVYYQAASGMYALAATGGSDDGWKYLTASELAARTEGSGNGYDGSSAAAQSTSASATGAGALEEGEVEDDVGWGGLMDPDKLARVVEADKRKKDGNNGSKTPGAAYSGWDERDRDPPAQDRRHPAYSNGYGFPTRELDGDRVVERERARYGDRDRDREVGGRQPFGDETSRPDTPEPSDPSAHILRLVIRRSKDLEVGAVAVLDAREGGIQLGRDRADPGAPARLRVREMEVSKTHALIYWGRSGGEAQGGDGDVDGNSEREGWWIVDLGSTLGTYVAHRAQREPTRLSPAKSSSCPYPLHHLSVVTVGTTTFVTHAHDDWPCDECQLSGNAQITLDDSTQAKKDTAGQDGSPAPMFPSRLALDAGQRRGERQLKRKLELTALRDSLLGGPSDAPPRQGRGPTGPYVDRSAQRRRLHGSSPPRRSSTATPPLTHPTPTPVPTAVSAASAGPSAVSRAMLVKHGWTEGKGLGRESTGRAEPVLLTLRNERAGLGARGEKRDVAASADDGGWKARGMRRRWDEVAR